jgi:hypothetical protein
LQTYDRIRSGGFPTLEAYWKQLFGRDGNRAKFTGNGYQRLRKSSRIRKNGDGQAGVSAAYLQGLPELTSEGLDDTLVDFAALKPFDLSRIHDPRSRSLFDAPLLIVHKSPPAGVGRIRVAVAEKDMVFNESYYGYSARQHAKGYQLVRYLALLLCSKPALWLALITSGEFGFEREVIEKSTIDSILVPTIESFTSADLDRIDPLFTSIVGGGDENTWAEIDAWVGRLYGLHERDLQVIADTLQFNLPFSNNRREAQARPTEKTVEQFCKILTTELEPWAQRFGRTILASPGSAFNASPWRSLRICPSPAAAEPADVEIPSWSGVLRLADQLAATEVVYAEPETGCLWLGRLDQARYWTRTQARLVAQRVIWEHVDLLSGKSAR